MYHCNNIHFFFVFAKGLRAQRAGLVAPRVAGGVRAAQSAALRAAALGAAQRRKAPPQAAERRAAHKACFSAFNFAPIIETQKKLTGRSAGIRPEFYDQSNLCLGIKLHANAQINFNIRDTNGHQRKKRTVKNTR